MKRSLFSKLLAGVMSLGMITGGNSIQNVCAMKLESEEDEEDEIVSGVGRNLAKNNKSGISPCSLEFIVKSLINPVWGEASVSTNGACPTLTSVLYAVHMTRGLLGACDKIHVQKPENVEEKAKIIGEYLGAPHLGISIGVILFNILRDFVD